MILVRPSLATTALVGPLVCLAAAPHAQSRQPVAVVTGGQLRGARVGSGAVFKASDPCFSKLSENPGDAHSRK